MSLTSKLALGTRALGRMTASQERELIRNYQLALSEIRGKVALAFERYDGSFVEMQRYNRLTNLEKAIGGEIATLTGKNAVNLRTGIAHQFAESYYWTGYAFETEVLARLGFGQLDRRVIEAAIDNPLDRVGFLQRNRDNQARLTRQLREQLTQGLIQGESYQKTARRIKERMDVGAENVLRIARTENHRSQSQGRVRAFNQVEDKGVEFDRIWDATLDGNTRPTHQDMDGEKANKDGLFYFVGGLVEGPGLSGLPGEDINCRCSIRAEIVGFGPEVRRAREVEGKRGELIDHTTYSQWKKARIGN